MAPEFNRERFLLKLLGAVFALQLLSYGIGAVACTYVGLKREKPVCQDFRGALQTVFDTGVTTILALMGGASLRKD